MPNTNLLQEFHAYQRKIASKRYVNFLINWDAATEAPKKSMLYRAQMQGELAADQFAYQMDPKNLDLLENVSNRSDIDELDRLSAKKYLKEINKIRNIPQKEYVQSVQNRSIISRVWEEAKQTNDYPLFAPYLDKFLNDVKMALYYRDVKQQDYFDVLLDDNEEGMDSKKYDLFFDTIKAELVPLMKKCLLQGREIDDSLLYAYGSKAKQEEMVRYLADVCYYDLKAGVIKTSVHPFTSSAGTPDDVRFTVRYHENYFTGSLMAAMHEMGHAIHAQQCDPASAGTNLFGGPSAGIAESQSRFNENYIGRSLAFWQTHYSKLQQVYPELLNNVGVTDFWRVLNRIKPTANRLEADELSYPFHIILRYELERGIFSNQISVKELPELWRQKSLEYLGVMPNNDSEGVLQDVHWGGTVGFGYFPTYALGTAYGAQFRAAMLRELEIDQAIRDNRLDRINSWLKEKIHFHCGSKTPEQILLDATGEAFNVRYYIDYLKEKYDMIYFH